MKFLRLFIYVLPLLALSSLVYSVSAQVSAPTEGLVAYYPLNGSANDQGGSNNGSLVGNPAWSESGKIGVAINLPGSGGSYVSLPASNLNLRGAMTISAWVRPNSAISNGTIVNKGTANLDASQEQYLLATISNGALVFRVSNGTAILGTSPFDSAVTPQGNTWYHVVGVYNGSDTVSLYVNGVLSTSATTANFGQLNSSSEGVKIGSDASVRPWNGLIDEVRIYNRSLSALEISQLYNAGGETPTGGQQEEEEDEEDPVTPEVTPSVNGVCGQTLNTCSTGSFSDQADTSSNSLWRCTGSNGGTTASCSLVIGNTTPSNFTTYYIDYDNGNDANDGGSPSTAWKHVPGAVEATDRAKATTLRGGNTVLFKGGVKYRGVVPLAFAGTSGSPIIYKGDGWPGLNGTKAIIDGSAVVSGWTRCTSSDPVCASHPSSSNIYYADIKIPSFLSDEPVFALNLYQNSQPLNPAQYPNALNPLYPKTTNFLSVPASSVTRTSLTDSRLASYGSNLVGKWVYLWINPNETVPRKITGYNSNTISFPNTLTYTDRNTLYAIVNSPLGSVFDTPGEFYLDETRRSDGTNRLYLWPLGNQNLIGSTAVSMGNQSAGIGGFYPTNITIDGFKIQYQTGDSYGEGNAIGGGGSSSGSNFIIKNNEITGVRAAGSALILVGNVNGVTVDNNYLHDTGAGGRGIQIAATNVKVRNNTIRNIAGTAIYFPGSSNSSITGNIIVDGGGSHANGISVYQGSNNVTISNNLVRNFNNALTVESSSNLKIFNNIFDGKDAVGYVVANWGGMTGTNLFANNTVLGSDSNCSVLLKDGNFVVKNNIMDGGGVSTGATSNNIYTSLCWSQAANYNWSLQAGESIINDLASIFVNSTSGDYRPLSTALTVDKGVSLSTSFDEDYAGTSRPQGSAWDIGAYEYYSGIPTPPVQTTNPITSPAGTTDTTPGTQTPATQTPGTQTPAGTPGTVTDTAGGGGAVTSAPTTAVGVNLSSASDLNMDLSRGSTAKEVLILQALLLQEGYLTGSYTDGVYDRATEEAVRSFQRKNNISSFGTVNAATRIKLNELLKSKRRVSAPVTTPTTTVVKLLTAPRTFGSTHEEIKKLQVFLNTNGFTIAASGPGSKGNETSYFGPATLKALNRFQISKSLTSRTLDITTVNLINTLATATSTPVTTLPTTNSIFSRTLSLGMSGPDVLALQQFLNTKGFTIATSGPGSKGNETTFFGAGTKAALIRFQETYRSEILIPNGLTKGTGSAGPSTIKKINLLR